MTELFSSFAISVAANIVTSLFARNDTEKEIRLAFQDAIETWCPNDEIRRLKEHEISLFVRKYIENPALSVNELSDEQRSFLVCFEKSIANHPSASSYLTAIKAKEYYNVAMASLQIVHTKLDAISQKLDDVNLRDTELHSEAVVQINTILHEEVVEPINAILFGVISIFNEDIFAFYEVLENETIAIQIDEGSQLKEDEHGLKFRPKFSDMNYDWDKEIHPNWKSISPDIDFWELLSESFIASFQLEEIDFYEGVEELQKYLDKKSINDQLYIDEKKHLTEIIATMRALQSILDDHPDIFVKTEKFHFKNLESKLISVIEDETAEYGHYHIIYNDGNYSETITEAYSSMEGHGNPLGVYVINPNYYFKLTGYMGHLFSLIPEWWEISNRHDED